MDKYQLVITLLESGKMYYLVPFPKNKYQEAENYLEEIAVANYVTFICEDGAQVLLREYLLNRSVIEIRKVEEKC